MDYEITPRTQEMLDIMAEKRTSLSAPGTRLNSLYYDNYQATVSAAECTFNTGRYITNLSSPSFAGTSTVILANNDFVSTVYLHAELPNLYPGQTLSRGWLWGAIQSISYLIGNSASSQVQIDGQSVWAKIAMQCDTAERRSEMFRLGGEEYLSPVMIVDPISGLPVRDPNFRIMADIIIPLPWSSASGLYSKKAFDSSLLNNPITITVAFENNTAVYGGSRVPNDFPVNFAAASLVFRQGELRYKNMSMASELKMYPELSMFYPDIFCTTQKPPIFQGSQTLPQTLNMLGILNGDLVATTIGIVRTSLLNSGPSLTAGVNTAPNKFQYDAIKDVSILFNGQVMFRSIGLAWRLYTMVSSAGAQYFHNSIISPSGPTTFVSSPQDSYLLHIDWSQIRSTCFEGQFQNVWRIGNNTLSLQFTTEGDSTVSYQAFITYYYNSIVQVNNGNTMLYFD
jgi:hypothetical protein